MERQGPDTLLMTYDTASSSTSWPSRRDKRAALSPKSDSEKVLEKFEKIESGTDMGWEDKDGVGSEARVVAADETQKPSLA